MIVLYYSYILSYRLLIFHLSQVTNIDSLRVLRQQSYIFLRKKSCILIVWFAFYLLLFAYPCLSRKICIKYIFLEDNSAGNVCCLANSRTYIHPDSGTSGKRCRNKCEGTTAVKSCHSINIGKCRPDHRPELLEIPDFLILLKNVN